MSKFFWGIVIGALTVGVCYFLSLTLAELHDILVSSNPHCLILPAITFCIYVH